jgi:CheY-like chemotaxis protein
MSANKILVVDDSPTTINLIRLHLKKLGYDVSGIAETAEAALQLVAKFPPDLVLMDIRLGEGMNGIEAADIIMNQFHIPVIYVTSYSDDDTLDRAKLSMPFGFINKPFRANDLRVNIEIALSRTSVPKQRSGSNIEQTGIGNSTMELSLLSEALDHLTSGILVIDENLHIYFNNKSAANILNENFSLRLKNDKLLCSNPKVRKNLVEQINKKTNVVFTISHKDKDLHVLIFPVSSQAGYDINYHSSSIMFLFDTVHDSNRIEEVVRTIYKLSPTEAKIASMLVFNPYLTDISASLGITYNTTRTHLKRIYQKTETNKLSALIQKIVTGPAGLLIHSIE